MPTKKQLVQDLRDAGLRKKTARQLAKAADQARSGDRAARSVVDQQSTALRDGISATVSHAKPPAKKSSAKKAAKKSTAKRSTAKRSTARKSTAKRPTARKSTAKKSSAKRTSRKSTARK
jgi:hypothetical protein